MRDMLKQIWQILLTLVRNLMSYKVYGNTELEESETACEPYSLVLRNSFIEGGSGNTGGLESRTEPAPRDAGGIAGTPSLIVENLYTSQSHDYLHKPGAVIRSEEYIYCDKVVGVGNSFVVQECKISDGTKTSVTVHSLSTTTTRLISYAHLAYISDRKVLAYCGCPATKPNDFHHRFYVVDFATGTATEVLDVDCTAIGANPGYQKNDIYEMFTLKKKNGDIWFYITGWAYNKGAGGVNRSSGIFLYYKNYTQDTDWQLVYSMPPIPSNGSWDSEFASQSTVLVGKKYLVHIDPLIVWDGSPGSPGYVGYVLDLDSNILSRSSIYESTDGWSPDICYKITADYNSEKVYFETYYFYDAGSSVEEFDPATLAFQCKFVNNDPDRDYYLYILSSRDRAYFYDYNIASSGGRKLYTASDAQEVGAFDIDPEWTWWEWDFDVCFRMDVAGIWWYDRTCYTMKLISITDGSVILSHDLTGLVTQRTKGTIWHMGNCLVLCNTDDWNHTFYLIK